MLKQLPLQTRLGLGLVMIALAAACGSDNSVAPSPVVTAVNASATPTTGTSFTFTGTITSTGAGPVSYRWERSDGVIDPEQSLQFGGAGSLSVSASWSPGLCVGTNRSLWVRLTVLSPNVVSSSNVPFTRTCVTILPVIPPVEPPPHS